jgi:ComF family protein
MGFITSLLDLLFPPKCVFCGRVLLDRDDHWCDKCVESLPFTLNGGKQDGVYYDFCIAPLYYKGVVRRSILRFKFKNASGYASAYGKMLADCIREQNITYDIISWVPLSDKRERKRGYDQAMLLALATALELGDVAAETLKKSRDVQAQSELGGAAERRANISGAYEAADAEIVEEKCVLLIDDIVTTGSTLEECANVLLSAGASRVICVALARGE